MTDPTPTPTPTPTTHTITIYSVTDGTVSSTGGTTTGAGTYAEGTQVTMTATAETNYRFVGWSGAPTFPVYSTDNPKTIYANGDLTYYAQFENATEEKTVTIDPHIYFQAGEESTMSFTLFNTPETGTTITVSVHKWNYYDDFTFDKTFTAGTPGSETIDTDSYVGYDGTTGISMTVTHGTGYKRAITAITYTYI